MCLNIFTSRMLAPTNVFKFCFENLEQKLKIISKQRSKQRFMYVRNHWLDTNLRWFCAAGSIFVGDNIMMLLAPQAKILKI